MNLRALALFCLALLTLPAAAAARQQPTPTPTPRPSLRDLVMKPVVYGVAGMEKVAVRPNLKYTTADNPNLLMDVYTPPGLSKGERRPAVIFIHGSAGAEAKAKDWGVYVSWGRLVAASGMVGVTFTHRLGYPKPFLNEAAGDVEAAVNYVRAHADTLGVDRERVCLAAYSGGGPLLSAAMRERPPYVRCLVSFYAFLDVRQSETHKAHETAETLERFSPVTYIDGGAGGIAPVFVARAGLDQIPTLNDSVDRFVREAVARNAAVTLFNHPRGVHGFDNQTPDARSREIVRAALDFMKTHLGLNEPR
ncbi:MAG TPA: alpha/beta hydrolase [Pyrinomonadaceae bacterium]|jgi:acetyl esterase/lipase